MYLILGFFWGKFFRNPSKLLMFCFLIFYTHVGHLVTLFFEIQNLLVSLKFQEPFNGVLIQETGKNTSGGSSLRLLEKDSEDKPSEEFEDIS